MDNSQWRGAGLGLSNAATFTLTDDLIFGDVFIKKGTEVKQWEGKNFGYTSWVAPKTGETLQTCRHIARE